MASLSPASWFRREPRVAVAALEPQHAPRLAALHAGAFAQGWDAAEFERMLATRGTCGDGLFLDDAREPCGFVLSRRVIDEAEILTVVVDRALRGRGHARPLMRHHLGVLARAGARVVHLEVEEGNAPALALYRRLGFVQVGRREGYYRGAEGLRAALTMSLRL